MIPHESGRPDDPEVWLQRARSNLLHAQQRAEGVYFEDLCFDAQQAAEKAIKALLIHLDVRFQYTHDIGDLLTQVQNNGQEVPGEILDATELSDFAVQTRYPGIVEPVTEQEYLEAISIAKRVVEWAENLIVNQQSRHDPHR